MQNTLADAELKKFTLNCDDEDLIKKWQLVLDEAKKPHSFTKYGLYQIQQELLEKKKSGKNKIIQTIQGHDARFYNTITEQEVVVPRNTNFINSGNLSSYITELTGSLKNYYTTYIESKLFQYQLLK